MPLPVSLHAVVEEMEMLGGEAGMRAFLNRRTGEVYGATADQVAAAEESDEDAEILDWEAEVIDRLQEVLDSPDWLELPGRDGLHEDYRDHGAAFAMSAAMVFFKRSGCRRSRVAALFAASRTRCTVTAFRTGGMRSAARNWRWRPRPGLRRMILPSSRRDEPTTHSLHLATGVANELPLGRRPAHDPASAVHGRVQRLLRLFRVDGPRW